MKKSNKLSFFYVVSAVGLFLTLLIGGGYGIYVSVGLNFVRSSVPGVTENGGVSNVSFGGSVNYTPSMTGVIFLSLILVVLAVFDFVSLIKQVVFFKQYKVIKNSELEKKIESKTKSKGAVIFWTILLDILSLVAGIVGIFINNRSFAGKSNFSWVFYAVDIAVSVLSLLSIILLIAKLKNKAVETNQGKNKIERKQANRSEPMKRQTQKQQMTAKDINQMEYNLIKLEAMKKGEIVSAEEYKKIRRKIINSSFSDNFFDNNKTDYWFFQLVLL